MRSHDLLANRLRSLAHSLLEVRIALPGRLQAQRVLQVREDIGGNLGVVNKLHGVILPGARGAVNTEAGSGGACLTISLDWQRWREYPKYGTSKRGGWI